jgi:hypothetical protein
VLKEEYAASPFMTCAAPPDWLSPVAQVPAIATIAGHAISNARSILDANRYHPGVEVAQSAACKVEERFETLSSR